MLRHALALAVACTAACSGPTYVVQQYDGPVRSQDTIAILRVNGKDPIRLESLDGEPVGTRVAEDSRLHVEMLPGRHQLRVRDLARQGAAPGRAAFMAEAGRVYRPVTSAPRDEITTTVRVFEVDADSDAVLRDVTLPGDKW